MLYRVLFTLFFIYPVNVYHTLLYARANLVPSSTARAQNALSEDSLFKDEEILWLKLTGRLNALFNDRGDKVLYHPALLQYRNKDSSTAAIQIRVQTRGNFRRKKENCTMPPLMLNFARAGNVKNSVFEKQSKLKLVVPCRGDEFVIREWLVYKLYNLITDKSFKARLVRVEFEDSLQKRKTEVHYCILLEDEKRVATRNKAIVWNKTMIAMKATDREQFLKMAVFQYMIGNTDWSVPYLQNIKLIIRDSAKTPYTVPYDFDHAGIVSAPYALPAEELQMSSVLERRYRGYCEGDKNGFAEVFTLFNALKPDIYNIYTSCTLLNDRYVKFVTKYLNDFYKVINSDREVEKEFKRPCNESTRIEIKGLKER